MEFIDVLFPLNLGPLTYRCPDHLAGRALPGMLVSAALRNRILKGIVLGKPQTALSGNIKDLSDIHGDSPLLGQPLMKLLAWISDYYITGQGVVLKNMLPAETFKRVRLRERQQVLETGRETFPLPQADEDLTSQITGACNKGDYRTFLVHAPTALHELSYLVKVLRSNYAGPSGQGAALILAPEITRLNHIAPYISEAVGDSLCIMHSGLSGGQRSDAVEKIISGKCHVVLGTRSAVFAPLKNVSLIAVIEEQSSSYKAEEGFRYNARDIAVMRGYIEKTVVMLSSICPSIESTYNTRQNKYTLLKPAATAQRPSIRILNMYNEKKAAPNLSKTVIEAAMSSIKKNGKVMLVMNRKGYSMLTCRECNHTETCQRCGIPLVFHKDEKSLRCHYCGSDSPPPEKCPRCGSFKIELAGSGIQRVEENIKRLMDLEPVRLDSDKVKRSAGSDELSRITKGETLLLGTRLLTKRLHPFEGFAMAAVLNADMYLNLPDFRSAEKAFQELYAISDKVKPDGRVLIQTRLPDNPLFRFIRDYDYAAFCKDELSRRKVLSYPPYSKIALVTFRGSGYDADKVRRIIDRCAEGSKDMEILGPLDRVSKKGAKEYTLLLKTASKIRLHFSVREFLKLSTESKDLKASIAIDP